MRGVFAVLYFVADLFCRAVDILFFATVYLTEAIIDGWCRCRRMLWKH